MVWSNCISKRNYTDMEDDGKSTEPLACKNLPNLLNSFVDTFVDFCVTGQIQPKIENTKPIQTVYPSPDRLIAVGDLHGDLEKSKQALTLAGLIDGSGRWSGGSTMLVQVGDVLDRGGDELKILYFLEKLKNEAARHGGEVITMNGNHEIMNMDGDFSFTSVSGFEEFRVWANWYKAGNSMKNLCHGLPKPTDIFERIPKSFTGLQPDLLDGYRARIAALRPCGPISKRFFSKNVTVAVVGESVFVHGGLLPKHVKYGLKKINEDVRDWIIGRKGEVSSTLVRERDSVLWTRNFSSEICDESTLEHVLATIPGAKRMIMGHTIQKNGINGVCNNKAIRIDVGLSKGCGNGRTEVLEINRGTELKFLKSISAYEHDQIAN